MAHISEVSPIITDPRHERYGQIGEMIFSGQSDDGTCLIKFEDGESLTFNDGWLTFLPQFVALFKNDSGQIERLTAALPELRPKIKEYFDQVEHPINSPAQQIQGAQLGFRALIDSVIQAE